MKQTAKHTPLMQQYFEIRARYPDALLLFQVGDFYELFFDDAKKASAFLGIALTVRGKDNGDPIPLCGVPVHALDHYLTKLVKGGFSVAICNQLEEPTPGKLVRRGVTQVLTPGTLTDSKLLDEKSASYLFSFFPTENSWGLLFGELLTAQLFATVLPAETSEKILESELSRFFPDEILLPRIAAAKKFQTRFSKLGYFTSMFDLDVTDHKEDELARSWIRDQFDKQLIETVEKQEAIRLALYYFYAYVRRNQESALSQFKTITWYRPDDFLLLDAATQRNLELVKNAHDGSRKNTLFSIMDHARTPMGSRMIKKWIQRPLINQDAIVQRQDAIASLLDDVVGTQQLEDVLSGLGDVERIVGRIALRRCHLNDFLSLNSALRLIPTLHELLADKTSLPLFAVIERHIEDFDDLYQILSGALNNDPSKDWIIKKGFDQELDTLRELVTNSSQAIVAMEKAEQEKTGIQSLKIRYNQVHGYYIEVTKTNLAFVPDHYVRQQTLVGRERYVTAQLQQLQSEIIRARTEINNVEQQIFERVKQRVMNHITPLRKLSHGLAHLDALFGFTRLAYNNGYVRPVFNQKRIISITAGRHPVVEQSVQNSFIPNDTLLDNAHSLWVITGPNMGGKSTYLRQVALITVMAQCGSFVPADKADLALLDRIFTRIGAGDNVAEGKSTFLVEMEETAAICTQATKNSLVILDEVGRGTSTFDGLAIAQSVVEYIHQTVGARCLFATHYHELTELQKHHKGIVSYYAASKRTEQGIIFLYKMIRGVADGSFGVEVAKLAELPGGVILRAQELLKELQEHGAGHQVARISESRIDDAIITEYERSLSDNKELRQQVQALHKQLQEAQLVVGRLQEVDYEHLSPRAAFDLIWQLKSQVLHEK
jgi:DNA mismatch repair protein MutS